MSNGIRERFIEVNSPSGVYIFFTRSYFTDNSLKLIQNLYLVIETPNIKFDNGFACLSIFKD